MHTARSARRVWSAPASAVEYTATASTPSSCSARITRTATSPRFATSTRENIARERPMEDAAAAPARPSYGRQPNTTRDDLSQRVERTTYDRLELEEQLSEFDGRRVLDEDRADDAVDIRLHFVHELQSLEDAERLPVSDRLPLLDERRRARLRRAVERADHWRLDTDQPVRRADHGRGFLLVRRAQRRLRRGLQRDAIFGAANRDAHP